MDLVSAYIELEYAGCAVITGYQIHPGDYIGFLSGNTLDCGKVETMDKTYLYVTNAMYGMRMFPISSMSILEHVPI